MDRSIIVLLLLTVVIGISVSRPIDLSEAELDFLARELSKDSELLHLLLRATNETTQDVATTTQRPTPTTTITTTTTTTTTKPTTPQPEPTLQPEPAAGVLNTQQLCSMARSLFSPGEGAPTGQKRSLVVNMIFLVCQPQAVFVAPGLTGDAAAEILPDKTAQETNGAPQSSGDRWQLIRDAIQQGTTNGEAENGEAENGDTGPEESQGETDNDDETQELTSGPTSTATSEDQPPEQQGNGTGDEDGEPPASGEDTWQALLQKLLNDEDNGVDNESDVVFVPYLTQETDVTEEQTQTPAATSRSPTTLASETADGGVAAAAADDGQDLEAELQTARRRYNMALDAREIQELELLIRLLELKETV